MHCTEDARLPIHLATRVVAHLTILLVTHAGVHIHVLLFVCVVDGERAGARLPVLALGEITRADPVIINYFYATLSDSRL